MLTCRAQRSNSYALQSRKNRFFISSGRLSINPTSISTLHQNNRLVRRLFSQSLRDPILRRLKSERLHQSASPNETQSSQSTILPIYRPLSPDQPISWATSKPARAMASGPVRPPDPVVLIDVPDQGMRVDQKPHSMYSSKSPSGASKSGTCTKRCLSACPAAVASAQETQSRPAWPRACRSR